MAKKNALTVWEISIIKTMLKYRPKLSQQAIHSYFSKPWRHFNQARISEIANGKLGELVPLASRREVENFMTSQNRVPVIASEYVNHINSLPFSLQLDLTCWPVGQGLFTSGAITSPQGGAFSWVYDCGSISKKLILLDAVQTYRHQHGASSIDLVTLSHFDEDHINGIVELIKGTRVGTLLLPYLPLWQRMWALLEQGISYESEIFDFFINPAEYMSERSNIEQIVFVSAAGTDDITSFPDDASGPEGPIQEPIFEGLEEIPGIDGDRLNSDQVKSRVRRLQPEGRIVIPPYWEFVPYNDAGKLPYASSHFKLRIERIVSALVKNPSQRARGLKLLKNVYDKTFGSGSKQRNIISLFLYSGPLSTRLTMQRCVSSHPIRWNDTFDNFGQLFTGDGYLSTSAELSALLRRYRGRLNRAGVLQVMHHGALGNWHSGVANALQPAASIFSSDPKRGKDPHPHAPVLRDFWLNCPVQVDTQSAFQLQLLLA